MVIHHQTLFISCIYINKQKNLTFVMFSVQLKAKGIVYGYYTVNRIWTTMQGPERRSYMCIFPCLASQKFYNIQISHLNFTCNNFDNKAIHTVPVKASFFINCLD